MYDMFTRFSFNVQTLRICCAAWQCIFSAAYPDSFYINLAGSENDLNHVLSTFVDSEHEITNFCHSHYVDMSEIQSIFQNSQNEFLILTLNIQSVNAKFDNLFPVIDNLSSQGLYFGAICLQETWTSNDSDLSLLQLLGYQLIHQGSKRQARRLDYIPKWELQL